MTIVKILHVSDNSDGLSKLGIGLRLLSPVAGDKLATRSLTVKGQFTSKNLEAPTLEFFCGGVLAQIPALKDQGAANNFSFNINLGTLGLPPEFSIQVFLHYENSPRIKLCEISATQAAFQPTYKPSINPIMVTSLGRSGSTLIMKLLLGHSKIVAAEVYPYEIRIASYWTRVLRTLSAPRLPGASVLDDLFKYSLGAVGSNPFAIHMQTRDQQKWLHQDYVDKLSVFCQSNIEDQYQLIAKEQKKSQPQYFAEKVPPSRSQDLLWELYPNAREIFLVRDFRDTVCSILSFNDKRGFLSFAKKADQSDVQYVQNLAGSIKQLYNNWLKRKDKAYLVRYEDVALQPEATIKGMMEYLDLPCSPSDISKMLEVSKKDKNELDKHKTSDSVESSIGRWKRDLPPNLQEACKDSFGDIAEYFGYTDK